MADHDGLIMNFCELTGASAQQVRTPLLGRPATDLTIPKATEYLSASRWDLDGACTSYFTDLEEGEQNPSNPAGESPEPEYTGPRTLDGRPAPQYAGPSSSSTAKKPQKRTGVATLSSLGGGPSHEDDDDDEDDDDEDERRGPRDLFAGGEKSGLAVQDPSQRSSDPRRLISDIVAKAKA